MSEKNNYDTLINQKIKLLQTTKYAFLIPVFQQWNLAFQIHYDNYRLEEQLTLLTGSGFFNSKNFLVQQTSVEFMKQYDFYFESFNRKFDFQFNQLFSSLNEVQKKVQKKEKYLENLTSWQKKAYQDFLVLEPALLATKVLPNFFQLLTDFFEELISEDFFEKQMEQLVFDFNYQLTTKTGEILKKLLTKIYDEYGIKPVQDQPSFNTTSKPFSDFNELNLLIVNDENSAWNFFSLPKTASFDEVQKMYKTLAKEYHPDTKKNSASDWKMQQLNLAYTILKSTFSNK